MPERIGVWALEPVSSGKEVATPLVELSDTETEQRLESLCVNSPEVLLPGLQLIGRQVPTDGGPLDLLGVDEEGRLVLFELKRGSLTRDAVAQILDYGSELANRTPQELAALIERSSGKLGIEPIEDFLDWYQQEFPDVVELPPARMRLMLVGLGVDERARRIVNHLARTGLDIQVLTFQAFRTGQQTFLARKLESVAPEARSNGTGSGQKESNQRRLTELARQQGVEELLTKAADFISAQLPSYRWPSKTTITYYLAEQTDAGKPTQRAYVSITVDVKMKGRLLLYCPKRAVEAAPSAVVRALDDITGARRTESDTMTLQIPLTESSWPAVEQPLGALLTAIFAGWKEKVRVESAHELQADSDVGVAIDV